MAVRRAGMLLWACVFHALVSCWPAGVAGDIPDDVVYTDLHKMVRLGDSVVLKCQFRGTPLAVYWKKGDDPRTAPNLVSWIPGDPVTGLCEGERPCQIMEMNVNYSLIIKEVSIAEQGRYICRVSSYNEMRIHNFTDIRVFSPPKEPFPVIDECVESESSTLDSTQPCSVLTNDNMVSISCTVTNYYSDLDLFFLHGSQKIRDIATNVWTNDDGTMNKSVYIKASASETHYVCIASRIPGSNDQRAATVMVKSLRPTGTESTITTPQRLHTSYSTTGVRMDMSNDNRAVKIAVPIIVIMVFIVGIGLVMCFAFRRRRRHTGSGGATKIGIDEEVPMLRKKSKLSGDTSIPSRHLKQDEPMSPEMKKFQKELKDTYCRKYRMIKTSPLDPESEKRLQQIYIKLELILDDEKKGEKKKPLEYDELFELIRTETGSGSKTRFAFIGEAGVGKSTLFARIAFDWATGKCLQEIDLLFLLPLREVMETKYFGDIALNYVSDDIELEGKEVDGFIKYHQRQVLFLFDGLDESKLHLKSPDCDNATASILRGDRFRKSAVIVTTRPSHVEQIKTNENIHKQYTFVQVEGFTRENMAEYVRRFFEDDTDSSSSLIEVMNTNEVIAEHMAPYPIFCSMLCHLWKSESKREKMQKLRTYSQIMKEMVFSLQEQYSSKYSDYENNMERTDEAMAKIGSVAFNGLLKNQLVFKKDKITSIIEDATIACKLGILSKESKLLPREIRQREKKQFADEFRFPHKLMQEFMAGQYLASLYNTNLSKFQRVLREKLLGSKEDFRYVLYFTASYGGAVGRSVIESLCHVQPEDDDLNFIMEVAFECQDMEAIDHVVNLVRRERELKLSGYMSHHAVCGYLLTLERCGQRAIRTNSLPRNLDSPSKASATSSSPYTAAVGLFTLEKLREFELWVDLDDDFYTGMATYASKSQIESWSHSYSTLGPSASQQYATGLFSMPELKSLNLKEVELDDEFFPAMVQVSPRSKIESWSHSYSFLGSPASQQYATGLFSMPKLTSLKLDEMELDEEFFSAMVLVSPQSKIEKLTLDGLTLTRHSLHTFLSLPCLQSLDMGRYNTYTETDNGDISVESSHASSVDKLSVCKRSVVDLWKLGLHTSCPRVNTLTINAYYDYDDVLSSDTVSMACSPFPHLTDLQFEWGSVDDPVSFCDAVMSSCPRLHTLFLDRVKLSNEKVTEIIKSMKTHPQLKTLKFYGCGTNEDLDPLIAEINKEGSLTVIATHGGI